MGDVQGQLDAAGFGGMVKEEIENQTRLIWIC